MFLREHNKTMHLYASCLPSPNIHLPVSLTGYLKKLYPTICVAETVEKMKKTNAYGNESLIRRKLRGLNQNVVKAVEVRQSHKQLWIGGISLESVDIDWRKI